MSNTIDLQIQTTASDGKHTPAEVVVMAKKENIAVAAITDHDTVAGVSEALASAQGSSVRVISGIEMSVEERGAHILGYGVDYRDANLLAALEEFCKGRIIGAQKMVENLASAGFVVTWENVMQEATGAVVARPHIARAILNRVENRAKLGEIATVHDFIETFLSDQSPHYVRRTHIGARDAIELLHRAGGVAVWSHPAIHFGGDYEELEKFLQELVGWGIEGLEVFSPSHTEDDVELLESLSVKYRLLRTAGSDFHEYQEGTSNGTELHPPQPGSHRRKAVEEWLKSPKGNTLEATAGKQWWGVHSARRVGDYPTYGFGTETIISELDAAMTRRQSASVLSESQM